MTDDIRDRSLSDRVVALGLAELTAAGETPAHTGQVSRACDDGAAELDADVLGSISEAEVNRALNRLEADGHVEAVEDESTSAVGKGRPRFVLATDAAAVVDAFAEDDQTGRLAARIEESL
jgi:predicted ArsR family transcriptional regulator